MRFKVRILPLAVCILLSTSGCGLSSANRNYNKALDAYEENNFAKAEEFFIKAIDDNSDKAEYHIDYGFTLLQSNEIEKAREQFNSVILDKDIPMVKENNKKAYRGLGIAYFLDRDYAKSIENFDSALAISQEEHLDFDIMCYKARALEYSGDNKGAVDLYTSILELKPKDAKIYNERANQYRLLGNYELSIADYDKALELDSNNLKHYIGKYITLKESNKNAEATAVLEQASSLEVNDESDKFELAKVHYYQAKYDIAMNELNQCIQAGFTQGYYFVGEINLIHGNYELAIENFNRYIEEGNVVSGILYNHMLTCYLQLEDFEQAKICLEKAKQFSDPSIKTALLKNEIIYLEKMGQFSEALTCMEQYLKICPEDGQAKKDYYFLKTRTQVVATQDQPTVQDNKDTTVIKP